MSGQPKRRDEPQIAILVDRSRDLPAARGLIGLEPDDRYHTTDNQVPLNARTLSRHDVLVIAGHGLATYAEREMEAIIQFVRRGGGLLLAASAGVFERYTGRAVGEMAVGAIGRGFGIEFPSPSDAAGQCELSADLVAGYPAKAVRIRQCPPMRGLLAEDVRLNGWSPVRAERRSTVLLSHRRTGEAAALAVRFGKGRVVAIGDTAFLHEWPCLRQLSTRLVDYLAAGSPSRGRARHLRYEILPPQKTCRVLNAEIRYTPPVEGRLPIVRRLVRQVVPALEAWVPAKKERKWRMELRPSCTASGAWWRPELQLGADASDAELACALGGSMIRPLMRPSPAGRALYGSVLGPNALFRYVGLYAMRLAGFEREAERLGEALDRESRRRFKGLDAGWWYAEGADAPGLWIWRELEARCGDDLLARFFKAIPKKLDRGAAPDGVFTALDLTIHFLSKAAGEDLYPWFAGLGATVHPLPRARYGSKAFKQGVRRALRQQLRNLAAPASERADALEALIARQDADKRPLRYAVRQLRSKEPATRLVGAARLARVRDARGLDCLRALAKSAEDPGLAAMAALLLVEQGDREAAARLARLATKCDHRFQLDAGCRLKRLGDTRAERFSVDGIRRADGRKAAGVDVEYGSEVKVFPVVDGRHVANIFSADGIEHMPGNTHVTRFFVHWVHTGPKFRRKGLARLAMQRSFDDPRARRCSCALLGTGTRNTAHALYRSFGFVDLRIGEELRRELKDELPPARAKGIRIRRYRPGDEAAMAGLFNACYRGFFAEGRRRPARLSPQALALVAHRGRRLVGYVTVHDEDEDGRFWIREMAVAPGKKREETAGALMTALHRLLKKRGAKTVCLYNACEALAPLIQPLGYTKRKTGGVAMFKLIHLPQFLEEIAPLLGRRLAKKDWHGTLALLGETHRAGLTVRNGRVTVHHRPPARADITLAGSDVAITQIVAGVHTPFEPYLQLDLRISPALNHRVLDLLETLFPRVETLW